MSIHAIGRGEKRRFKVRWRDGDANRARTFDRRASARQARVA